MSSINFPSYQEQHYYKSHYAYLAGLLNGAGVRVNYKPLPFDDRGFCMEYNGLRAFIDFGDHPQVSKNQNGYDISFRYHYSQIHRSLKHCYPLAPISFYSWDLFREMEREISYRAESNLILNKQRPGAAAKKRREKIQRLLWKKYGEDVDLSITSQVDFWKKINSCLVSVCVPGARNDILDRGQLQYIAFGACTISPPIDIILPYWTKLVPGLHYLACAPDYSNLFGIIEFCKDNRELCRQIGQQAKQLFQETCTPRKIWSWINQCMEEL